jgi:hypothetical protein
MNAIYAICIGLLPVIVNTMLVSQGPYPAAAGTDNCHNNPME